MPTPSTTPSPEPQAKPPTPFNSKLSDALNKYADLPADTVPPTPSRVNPPTSPPPPPKAPEALKEPTPPAKSFELPDEPVPVAPLAKVEPQPAKEPEKPVPPEPKLEDGKPAKIDQLRDAYERLKEEHTKAVLAHDVTKKDLEEFRKKSEQFESRIKALEPVEAHAKELEKKVVDYDEQLRIRNYVEHPKFHEEFVKPVADAMATAHELVKQMIVDENGSPHAGTPDDFASVLRAGTLTEAVRVAKALFGDDLAQTVVNQRNEVLRLERKQAEGFKSAALKSQEWAQEQTRLQQEKVTKFQSRYQQESKELLSKYGQVYLPPENDKEAREVYERGSKIARDAIHGNPDLQPEELISAMAKTEHRAASFPLALLKIHRLEQEVEQYKTKLASFEKSVPTVEGRKPAVEPTKPGEKDLHSRLHSDLEEYSRRKV